jgi:hypothetical protein
MKLFTTVFTLFVLTACISRQEVQGNIWNMDRLPQSLCNQYPFLKQYGAFRVISCKGLESKPECQGGVDSFDEVVPFCSNRFENMLGADRVVVEAWLKKLGRPK